MKTEKKTSQCIHSTIASALSRLVSPSTEGVEKWPFCGTGILYQPLRPVVNKEDGTEPQDE